MEIIPDLPTFAQTPRVTCEVRTIHIPPQQGAHQGRLMPNMLAPSHCNLDLLAKECSQSYHRSDAARLMRDPDVSYSAATGGTTRLSDGKIVSAIELHFKFCAQLTPDLPTFAPTPRATFKMRTFRIPPQQGGQQDCQMAKMLATLSCILNSAHN